VTWRTLTCVEVVCDHCGDGWDTDQTGWPVHFADRAAAVAFLTDAGWVLDPTDPGAPDQLGHIRHAEVDAGGGVGPRVWCPACLVRIACQARSHVWQPWHTTASGRYRLCEACDDGEWDPLPGGTLATPAVAVLVAAAEPSPARGGTGPLTAADDPGEDDPRPGGDGVR
jgi:hypothetical protein